MRCALINYARHDIPQDIATRCSKILRDATTHKVIQIHNKYEFGFDSKITPNDTGNYYFDLYSNLLKIITQDESEIFFFIEGDIEYNKEHFEILEQSIRKEPSSIWCNKNLLQQVGLDYRKNQEYIRPLSTLAGHRETLEKELHKKILELSITGKVAWLEPGYDEDSVCTIKDCKSSIPIIETRHIHSTTSLSSWTVKNMSNVKITSVKKQKTKVALIGIISYIEPQYSVSSCILDQINLLSRKYNNFIFMAPEDFKSHEIIPDNCEVRYFPRFHGDPLKITKEKFDKFAKHCGESMYESLKDCTTCIENDGIFLESFLTYNAAIRHAAQKLKKLKWVHWIHSAPNTNPPEEEYPKNLLRKPMDKNSTFICLNKSNMGNLAKMYSIDESQVVFMPNFVDPPRMMEFHPLTKEIYYHQKLWEYDVICVYPARTVTGKQPDKVIKFLSFLKKSGLKVKFIYCNSYSSGQQEQEYLTQLTEIAHNYNFADEFFPTSSFISDWILDNDYNITLGVPQKVVQDLFKIGDLFVLPSVSEGCSLIMLEAALHKNMIILNDDLFTLHDFGGDKFDKNNSEKSFYCRFGSIMNQLSMNDKDYDKYLNQTASEFIRNINSNQALNFFKYIRKNHSPDWVFDNILSKLIN